MGFWSKLNSGDARGTIAVVGAVGAPHGGDPESTLELSAQGDYFLIHSLIFFNCKKAPKEQNLNLLLISNDLYGLNIV